MCINELFFATLVCLSPDDSVSGSIRRQQLWARLILERMLENLIDPANRHNLQVRFDIFRDIRKVLLIIRRNQDLLDVTTMCGEQFLFETTYFSEPALEA